MKVHTDAVSLVVAGITGYFSVSSLLDGGVLPALLFAVVAVAVLTRRQATAGDA